MKKGWVKSHFGDVCHYRKNNGTHKDLRYIGLEHIEQGNGQLLGTLDSNSVLSTSFRFQKGDVLYGRLRPYLKKAYVAEFDGCCSTEIFPIHSECINPSFLKYWFLSDKTTQAINETCSGCRMPRGNMNEVLKFDFCYPPLSEQQEIVEYLDSSFAKIDALKANAAKNLEEAKSLFQSALKEALEPKEGWEENLLGEIGTLIRGGNFSKKDFVEDGFPCIHYGQIHMKFGTKTYEHISCVPKEMVKPLRCAHKGDLIIAITSEDDAGSCKCTAWMSDYDVYVGGHTAIYSHSLNPVFMSYFFQSPSFQSQKLEYTHGFKVVEINPKDIAKIKISYPDSDKQQSIVSHLDSLNEKVNTLQQNYSRICNECDALKQAILRQVFE